LLAIRQGSAPRIHGIKAADVLDAPAFADAAATVWQLLTGRVLVAHNVPFEAPFLDAEFSRCGVRLPPPPVMCTMQLASSYLSDLPGRSLAACGAAARITMSNWAQALGQASDASWLPAPGYVEFRPLTRKQQSRLAVAQRPPLAGLVDRLPRGATMELDAYLAVLDRVLEDRIITADEVAELTAPAADLGLTSDSAIRARTN
jgi:DNA polymerase III subunit epsilon